jgi:hypothetical protein
MKIYTNKNNNKSYTIEILKSPMPFLDGSSRLGVYAIPYLWEGDHIWFKSTDYNGACLHWIYDNFTEIAEI